MNSRPNVPRRRTRCGFSLLELMVTLFCVVLLLALLTPYVGRKSRGPARQTESLNNLKSIAIACETYKAAHETLPPLDDGEFSWPTLLLSHLDSAALYRQILHNRDQGIEPIHPPFHLKVYTSPHHDQSGLPYPLSYVVNAGFGNFDVEAESGAIRETRLHSMEQDWDGDGNVSGEECEFTRATGVFWRPARGMAAFSTQEVIDGASQTLLMAENRQARNWSSRRTADIAFVIGRSAFTFDAPLSMRLRSLDLGPFAINANPDLPAGFAPRPTSDTRGNVCAAFCDGSARTLSADIDRDIYVRHMTSQGTRYGETAIVED